MTDALRPSILAVAPYEGLGDLIRQNHRRAEQAQISVVVGDWDVGLEQARQALAAQDFDVLVSRGGTAELLRKSLDIPILDIEITANDILHAVRLADAYDGKSAFVGFEAITKIASLLCQLLDYDMPVYTVHQPEEVDSILKQLSTDGFSLVLCDVVVSMKASQYALTPVLITSTEASVDKILEEAISIAQPLRRIKRELQLRSRILENNPVYSIMFDSENAPLFSTLPESLYCALSPELPGLCAGEQGHIFSKQLENQIYTIEVRQDPAFPGCTMVYIYTKKDAAVTSDGFLQSYSGGRKVMDYFMNQPLYVALSSSAHLDQLSSRITGFKPVLITGEDPAFQDILAGILFTQFRPETDTYTVADLALADSGRIDWLLDSPGSPLHSSNTTVYLKNSQLLSERQILRLERMIKDAGFLKTNWLLISTASASESAARIANVLTTELVSTPTLQECGQMLHNLMLICINRFNALYSKQVISLSPGARQVIGEYPWPGNYPQFLRVMETLVVREQGMYIQTENVRSVLAEEARLYPLRQPEGTATVDLNQPLNDILGEIVKKTVELNGGNQKKAAEILGISRTTVWRMLKKGSEMPSGE